MVALLGFINRCLPFATPGTPLLQDLAHLAALCLLLYFAPTIQEWSRTRIQHTSEAISTIIDAETVDYNDSTDRRARASADDPVNLAVNEHAVQPGVAGQEVPADDADVQGDRDDAEENADDPEVPAAGPTPSDGNIGAKKAKSLARKDQRRAYHEFLRSQGEAQRARDAEGAAEREASLEAEKKRRALAEADLVARKAREREQKREAEQAAREAEYQRRETAIAIVKADLLATKMSDLHKVARVVGGDVDEEWVEKVIHASGILGRHDDVLTMITTAGWAARIDEKDARAFYDQIANIDLSDEHGYMDEGKVSERLVSVLTGSLVTASA